MKVKIVKIPVAFIFGVVSVVVAALVQNAYWLAGLLGSSLLLAGLFAVYGLVNAKRMKRSKLLVASDIAAVVILLGFAWLLYSEFQAFNGWSF
jgi:uncharacterized membrane protein YecN with MAPEG domain